jgi:hypothetical protein
MRDFLHHLFLPRESNNHRAKLLHHSSLLAVIAVLLLFELFLSSVRQQTGVLGINGNISIDELLALTNQKRIEKGLKPLSLNQQLSSAAVSKAQDMFSKDYWAHNSPDGLTPWVFIKGAGYDYIYAGENLARGFSSAPDVVNAWMNSPGHRDNILSPNYTEIGFAVMPGKLTGDETILVVQEFGSRSSESAPKEIATVAVNTPPSPTVSLLPSPTSVRVIPTITVTPAPVIVTEMPPTPTPVVLPNSQLSVASVQTKPLVNPDNLTRNLSVVLLAVFILTLIFDIIIIERRKIVRVVAHNLDHIVYLSIIMVVVAVMVGRGVIL